jgi:hypothetical protein
VTTRNNHLAILQKRAEHLRARIAQAERNGRDLSFDKAERAALQWAIQELRNQPFRRDDVGQ